MPDDVFDEHDPDAPWRRRADVSPLAPSARLENGFGTAVDPIAPVPLERVDDPVRADADADGDGDGVDGGQHRESRSRRRRFRTAIGVLVLTSVAIVTVVAVARRRSQTESTAPFLPPAATVRWTKTFDASVDAAVVGEGIVVVAVGDGVTALTLESGDVLWRAATDPAGAEIDRIAIVDDRVVIQQRPSRNSVLMAVDRITGADVWRSRSVGNATIAGPTAAPLLVFRHRSDDATFLELIDPVDGSSIGEPVTVAGASAPAGSLGIQPSRRKVAVWSIEEMEVVAGPVDAFNLRSVASLDGAVVALDLEGRVAAFDREGRRTDELPLFDASDDESGGRLDLVGVIADQIGVIAGEQSMAFRVTDGRIETIWRHAGRVTPPVVTDRGERSLLIAAGGEGGAIREVIIDPADGSAFAEIGDGVLRERVAELGRNGYVIAPEVDGAVRALQGFDYDGRLLWSLELSPEADYTVEGGVVLVVEATSEGSRVSIAR